MSLNELKWILIGLTELKWTSIGLMELGQAQMNKLKLNYYPLATDICSVEKGTMQGRTEFSEHM